jgi:hypothetical protein
MDKRELVRQKTWIGTFCCILIAIILAGTLWPYNLFPPNRVTWLVGANGIEFKRAGVVVSNHPLETPEGGEACSLEVLVHPATTDVEKTILSFYTQKNSRQFRLRQEENTLVIAREFVDAPRKAELSRLGVAETFAPNELALITITSGPHGTIIYKNGRRFDSYSTFRISPTDFSGQIVLGTSAADYDPWEGQVRRLALYAKELTPEEALHHYVDFRASRAAPPDLNGVLAFYDFSERTGRHIHNAVLAGPDLQIPQIFRVPEKPLLASPRKEFAMTRRYVRSVLLNTVMFVPLGFVFCVYWLLTQNYWQAVVSAILGAALLSTIIEVLQAYIPLRFSGMTDILTNTVGAGLGALVAAQATARTGTFVSW